MGSMMFDQPWAKASTIPASRAEMARTAQIGSSKAYMMESFNFGGSARGFEFAPKLNGINR